VRRAPALLSTLAVAAVVVTSLVGCSSDSSSSAAACPSIYPSGAASSMVTATGSTTSAPTVTFPTPLVATDNQVSVVKSGSGAPIQKGEQVDYKVSVYSGKTGALLGNVGYGSSATPIRSGAVTELSGKTATAVMQSLICATTGERYVLTSNAKDAFGAGALTSNNVSDSDSLVVVVDVADHFLGKADGFNLLPQDGLPSVVTAVNGQPGLVIQELAMPTSLRIETVKGGSGAVVKDKQTVHMKYSGWIWPATGSKLDAPWDDSSWTKDQAVDVPVNSSLPIGLYKALLGAKVGSQVLAVIPPKDGFPSGTVSSIPDGSTIVMVIDVLGIK
jgi:hypothetical protein